MFIDNQVPRDIGAIKLQLAELIAQELDWMLARARKGAAHSNPSHSCKSSEGDGKVLHYADAHPEEANQHHD